MIDLDTLSVTMEAGYGEDGDLRECDECNGSGELDGEAEGNYHDCPGAALGTCDPCEPKADCPDCDGKGYVTPPVKCDACDGSGDVDATYRESI